MSAPAPSEAAVSIIVPVLDEEVELEATLGRARRAIGPPLEFVIVDGGSRDRTRMIAAGFGRVIDSEPCRGIQLRAGAEAAAGRILLFLHADTWLDPRAGEAIRGAVRAGADAGCFRFALRATGLRYRILELGVNGRTHLFRTATGDQALFATRAAYDALGGFDPIPLFEDVRFARAARRRLRWVALPQRAHTSARRWERDGFPRTVARHLGLRALHALGRPPGGLAERYARRASRGSA